jgi:hypothetical protein
MSTESSHGADSRRPVYSGNRRVPGLLERTLADGSTVFEARLPEAATTGTRFRAPGAGASAPPPDHARVAQVRKRCRADAVRRPRACVAALFELNRT